MEALPETGRPVEVSLDIHDASIVSIRWEYLERLKERFPKMKVSLFFIAWDYQTEMNLLRLVKDEGLQRLKSNLDWIRLYPHGLTHFPREFEKADTEATEKALQAVDDIMSQYKLSYQKGFCAPYWLWNDEVVSVLDKQGWWGAVDRNQPNMPKPKRFYRYSHSIHEPFWMDKDAKVWKLHGHMDLPSANALELCLFNLLKIPDEAEWHYIDDYVETGEGQA